MVNKGDLSKFLVTLNNKNTVNFSEGGKQSQFKFMQAFLQNLPSVVSYGEVAAPEVKPKDSIKLQPAAAGYSYSEENLEIHKRALDYSEKNNVDYAVAIKHVLTYN